MLSTLIIRVRDPPTLVWELPDTGLGALSTVFFGFFRYKGDLRRMRSLSTSALWVNLLLISGTWGSSFVLVKLFTESIHPFAFAASLGLIAMSAPLAWLALRSRMRPARHGPLLPRVRGTLIAVARRPGARG